MTVSVFDPQISVVLKKNIGRATVAGAIAASRRFQGTAREIDLTPWLGDNGGVKTQKSVRQPAGTFTITLADKMEPSQQDSLYAAIEPMDVVEIRMARDVSKYSGAFPNHMPIHMRGFVTDVRRSRRMTERGPERIVTIYGQDYGKLLQINQVIYLPPAPTGNKLLTVFNLFANYDVPVEVDQDASAFMSAMVDKVVNKFIADMKAAATASGVAGGITPLMPLAVDAVVRGGIVSPFGTQQASGPVYEIMKTYGDVGAWNELFVDDREDGPYLVYRPNPFKDVGGVWVQEPYQSDPATRPAVNTITDADIIADDEERSDTGVANWYWVDNSSYQLVGGPILQAAAASGPENGSFYLADYPNSSPALYGIRRLEVQSMQGPRYDGKPANVVAEKSTDAVAFMGQKRQVLIDSNRDNVVFEKGSMTIRGNEAIRAGTILEVRNGAISAECYAHTVTQEFSPMRRYMTSIAFDRGTGFIERIQRAKGTYLAEMKVGGVYGGSG